MATEFGVRGHRFGNEEPGTFRDGRIVTDTSLAALQAVQFDLEAINLGFTATVQWDMYDAWYDRKMGYGVIGSVDTHWERRPAYYALQLLTHTARVGWHGVRVMGNDREITVAAMNGDGTERLVYLLNSGSDRRWVSVGGLPSQMIFHSSIWSGTAAPARPDGDVRTNERGRIEIALPPGSLVALTSL